MQRLLEFASLAQACAPFHAAAARRSRPVTHAVPRLLRALFIKYWYELSLRQLEERLRHDMLVRWFTGYGLDEATPDHTILNLFEAYFYQEHQSL